MAFINNNDTNENIEDDLPSQRKIQSVKKNWLTKNLILFLLIIAFIYVLFNMGGDGKKSKDENKKDDFLDVQEETTVFSDYIEEPVKTIAEKAKVHVEQKQEKEEKPIIYKEWPNKYKRKTQTKKTKPEDQNLSRSYPTQPTRANDFDRAAYMKEVIDGVNNIGREKPEPTLDERLKVEEVESSYAYLEKDLDMKLLPGKLIPAILEFSVHSSLPGKLRAIIKNDVYSEDGKRVIFPGGSRLVGQYAGGMNFGINRLFIIWENVFTKDGHVINIASPSVGPLGRSGLDMFIDSHFWERFGSSMLLSVINAGVSIAGGIASDGSQQTVQDIQANLNRSSEMALEQALKIKPTGHEYHGSEILVFVARKLDFTRIYKAEAL